MKKSLGILKAIIKEAVENSLNDQEDELSDDEKYHVALLSRGDTPSPSALAKKIASGQGGLSSLRRVASRISQNTNIDLPEDGDDDAKTITGLASFLDKASYASKNKKW